MFAENVDEIDGRNRFPMAGIMNIIGRIDEQQLRHYVSSITYDVESQRVFIQLTNNLLSEEVERIEAARAPVPADPEVTFARNRIRSLSDQFRDTYPRLLRAFEDWKPARETLVRLSKSGARNLDRNSKWLSCTRLVCSTVDLIGTLGEIVLRRKESAWGESAFDIASAFGFAGLFATMLELSLSKRIHRGVIRSVKQDQQYFQPIKTWLEQTSELEAAVRELFPYGIDKELVARIEESLSMLDSHSKVFVSTVVTNARRDITFFKDENLLQKAIYFSRSAAAELWWNKVILEDHAIFSEGLRSFLDDDIRKTKASIRNMVGTELLLEAGMSLAYNTRAKVLLTIANLMSAWTDLSDEAPADVSENFRELGQKTEAELRGITSIVELLRPRQ